MTVRRICIVLCLLAALATAVLGLCSMRAPITIADSLRNYCEAIPWQYYKGQPYRTIPAARLRGEYYAEIHRGQAAFQVFLGDTRPVPDAQRFGLLGFAYEMDPVAWVPRWGVGTPAMVFTMRLWTPFALFAVYPVFALLRPRLRSARRWARSQCLGCGYNLAGNESGVCPECGKPTETWRLPRWQRILIALLGAVIFGWLVEPLFQLTALDHRVAAWFSAVSETHRGSWIVMSATRSIIAGLGGIGMYSYLSPERFAK